MNQNEFKEYLQVQSEEMKKHKWIESERVGYDLGNAAINDWISKFAKQFRQQWESNHENNQNNL